MKNPRLSDRLMLVACALSLATTTITQAQQTTEATEPAVQLPPAKQIMEDFLTAVGGRDKWEQHNSTLVKGKFTMPEMGLEAPMEIKQRSPSFIAVAIELPGAGTIRQGTNGDVAWEINPMTGARVLEDKEKKQFLKQADIQADLHFDRYYKSAETVAQEAIDGRPHYKVKLTTIDDGEETRYYDCETHLLTKTEQSLSTAMGDFDVVILASDYQQVAGGITVPFKSAQQTMGQKMVVVVESFEPNAEFSDDVFALPEEIQKLTDG